MDDILMKAQMLRIVAVLSFFFVGLGTTQAHSYYYHHGHCSNWAISWGGGWYGPRWGGYWGPPMSVGWWPAYYYPSTAFIIHTEPTHVFYQSVQHPSSILVKAQTELENLGYYHGPLDGSFGPVTKKAVEMFQGENGLPVTGRLDL
ncbi:MAG: hypothetical protein C5B47_07875, partial [Verrucomicrobia bacterium]